MNTVKIQKKNNQHYSCVFKITNIYNYKIPSNIISYSYVLYII